MARGPDGVFYCPPCNATHVLAIDPWTDSVYEVGRSLGKGGDKWSAIVVGCDGRLYCPPRGAKTCLVIDPATDTVEELPGQVSEGGKWQWMAAVASARGTIVSPPCMQERVLSIAFSAARPTRVLVTGAGGRTGSMVLQKMAG